MKKFKADLHIHTVLSPCADLEMTPQKIVKKARGRGLDIIGITDHNSTRNALLVKNVAQKEGIFTLTGVEVTTREEVHCLAFFEQENQLLLFQKFLEENLTKIPNLNGHFGYQPVIDEQENIIELIPFFLPAALKSSIQQVHKVVRELDGLFIPAHIDRQANSILTQLGFIPEDLSYDALELSRNGSEKHVEKQYGFPDNTCFIHSSDAHYLEQIGDICTVFYIKDMSFPEIKKALHKKECRFVEKI
ncbi:MAG: PHP domain-containing protein [Mariniphaga sp.]